jgi:hypothetical protein
VSRAVVLVLLLLSACAGTAPPGGTAPKAPPEKSIEPYEQYVKNPTEIRADDVKAVLPAKWAGDLHLTGLSEGFTDRPGGRREWTGTGDCRLELFALRIRAKKLTVTLVPDQPAPEVLLSAEGNVVVAHVSHGVGNLTEGKKLVVIRNDRTIER